MINKYAATVQVCATLMTVLEMIPESQRHDVFDQVASRFARLNYHDFAVHYAACPPVPSDTPAIAL